MTHEAPESIAPSKTSRVAMINILKKDFSDEDRLQIFNQFCTYCGSANPECQCENDD